MESIYTAMFLLQFLIFTGIFFVKLYNLLVGGELFKGKEPKKEKRNGYVWSFMTFAGILIFYGIGFSVSILGFDEIIFLQIFRFQTVFLILSVMITIIELFIYLGVMATNNVKSYLPEKR